MSTPTQSEQECIRTINKMLESHEHFAYYANIGLLRDAHRIIASAVNHKDILYAWPEVHGTEENNESGVIHVLTDKLLISATYADEEPSTATVRPLNLTGLEVTPEYKRQMDHLYVLKYTLKLQHAGEMEPTTITATHGGMGHLTEKLQEAFTTLVPTLGTPESAT